MPDLLPDDFGTETVSPPLVVLREQAEHLTRRTGGLVVARVSTAATGAPTFLHRFILEVPSLDDYVFELLLVSHPLTFYPLEFWGGSPNIPHFKDIKDQGQFEVALREFFAHPEVRRIVASLKAQAAVTVGTEAKP
jgi:hypothetical protein